VSSAARRASRAHAHRARVGARGLEVELRRRVRGWSPTRRDLARWASVAAESARLNARFRGRDRPTNVLSFAAGEAPHPDRRALGELVICAGVLRAEARAQDKPLKAHWAHLVVHGTLHLIGYDHAREKDARRMERREIAVLRRLGFANPYRSS